jgi:hypothetical protein
MADSVQVEAARIPDRDRLLEMLVEHGLPAEPVGEVEIAIPFEDDAEGAGNAMLAEVEGIVMDLGGPFVPMKHEGVIYVRPPIA